MPLGVKRETVRIELPAEGEWVEVLETWGIHEDRKQQSILASRSGTVQEGKVFDISWAEALDIGQWAPTVVAIQNWSFEEPITLENVRLLDSDSIKVIDEAITELYDLPGEEESKSLEEAGPPTLAGRLAPQKN